MDYTLIYPLIPSLISVILIYFYASTFYVNDHKKIAFLQPVCIVPIFFACSLSILTPGFNKEFTIFTMAGLLLALIGDMNNVDIQDNMDTLMRGLMIAVVAYSCYWIGIWRVNGYQKEDLGIGI